jgi:UDP:flavonoid glycosyltransferase YjiC (YdhE family)
VVIPYSFDQPDNAARLRRLSVAEILPRNAITARNLAAKLERLLKTPAATNAATQLASMIHPQDAMNQALDKMESVVGKA